MAPPLLLPMIRKGDQVIRGVVHPGRIRRIMSHQVVITGHPVVIITPIMRRIAILWMATHLLVLVMVMVRQLLPVLLVVTPIRPLVRLHLVVVVGVGKRPMGVAMAVPSRLPTHRPRQPINH